MPKQRVRQTKNSGKQPDERVLSRLGKNVRHGNLREKLPDIRDVKITEEGCWRAGLASRPWDGGNGWDLKLMV